MPPLVADAFARARKRAALVAFFTAGFPRRDSTVPMLRALADAGADIVEMGVPFSDPMADGPAIQRANARALENGITLHAALDQLAEFRQENQTVPVLTMGYANSFLQLGPDGFADRAAQSGASGAIIVDLADPDFVVWQKSLAAKKLDLVSLIAPTTPPQRLAEIVRRASGFLYFISLKGVTGRENWTLKRRPKKSAKFANWAGRRLPWASESEPPRTPARWRSMPTDWWWAAA